MVMDDELDPTCFNEIELSTYELNFDNLIAEELPLIANDAISSAAISADDSVADCIARCSNEDSFASSDLSEEEIDGTNMMDEALSESSSTLEEETTDNELFAHQIEVQTNTYSALIKKLKNNQSSFNDMLSYLNSNLFGVNVELPNGIQRLIQHSTLNIQHSTLNTQH